MDEIGHCTDVLAFEGLGEDTRAYLDWLLGECAEDGGDVDSLIEPAASDLMAMRLSTPLQFGARPGDDLPGCSRNRKAASYRSMIYMPPSSPRPRSSVYLP